MAAIGGIPYGESLAQGIEAIWDEEIHRLPIHFVGVSRAQIDVLVVSYCVISKMKEC